MSIQLGLKELSLCVWLYSAKVGGKWEFTAGAERVKFLTQLSRAGKWRLGHEYMAGTEGVKFMFVTLLSTTGRWRPVYQGMKELSLWLYETGRWRTDSWIKTYWKKSTPISALVPLQPTFPVHFATFHYDSKGLIAFGEMGIHVPIYRGARNWTKSAV